MKHYHDEDMLKLKLQLFANENTNVTTDEGMEPETDKGFYKTKLLRYAEPELLYHKFGKQVNIPKNSGGDTIEFRYMEPLDTVTDDLVEGVTPDGGKASFVKLTEKLHQRGAYITLSDKLQMTSIDPVLSEIVTAQGRQSGRSIDTLDREVVHSGTNVLYAPNYNAATDTYTENVARNTLDGTALMTVDLLLQGAAILQGQDAPLIDNEYICIMHPYVACDLKRTKEWQDLQRYVHPEKIYRGEIGNVGNIRVIENTRAKIRAGEGAGSLSIYDTMILGADAYAVTELEGAGLEHIVKQLGSSGTNDPLNQRSTTGWKIFQLAKILIQQYMLRIETTCKTMPRANAN